MYKTRLHYSRGMGSIWESGMILNIKQEWGEKMSVLISLCVVKRKSNGRKLGVNKTRRQQNKWEHEIKIKNCERKWLTLAVFFLENPKSSSSLGSVAKFRFLEGKKECNDYRNKMI